MGSQSTVAKGRAPARGGSLRRRKIPRVGDSVATASSAPRSGALAATLSGGLRPGSLRVHDPCRESGHGSRLGFPGRRPPRDPTASANVARGLQALLPWRDPLAERKPVSAFLRICFPRRLAGGGGRGPAARRRISQPIVPNKWRINSPRTDGRGLRQDPPGPVRLPMKGPAGWYSQTAVRHPPTPWPRPPGG